MAERRLYFRIKRDDNDGYDRSYLVHHRCRPLPKGNQDADVLEFWPYLGGMGMPTGVPFPVPAQDNCGACGRVVTAMFEWTEGPMLWTPGL